MAQLEIKLLLDRLARLGLGSVLKPLVVDEMK
jgi:hypothetical protein